MSKQYIERYWRNATPEDAIKDPPITNLCGMPIIISDFLGNHCEWRQVRFPRSKKKRIRKKWAKQSKHRQMVRWQEPVGYVFMNKTLIMNSTAYVSLRKETNAKKDSKSQEPIQRAADYASGVSIRPEILRTVGRKVKK